jgi:phosphoribosyl-ATP pyrophosphohydrolase
MSSDDQSLGAVLDALAETIAARAGADADADAAISYTAQLLKAGPARCAKKLGEEAVEAAIAAAQGDAEALTAEAADVLYHLLVLLHAANVPPSAVAAVLAQRQSTSGLAEKAARPQSEG